MFNRIRHINWKNILSGVLWVLGLGGLFTLMSFIHVKSSELACRELKIVIPGEQSFVERDDIDRMIVKTQGSLEGRTLQSVPLHEIEKELRTNPHIEKATVFMDMDGTIQIRIRQKEALLRIINASGTDFYLDTKGLKMPVSLKYAPHVLVANGFISEGYNRGTDDSIQTEQVKHLFRTAKFVSADSLWNEQVEQLYINAEQDIELVPRVGSQRIVLGDADSIERKFRKLELFYKQVVPRVGWDAYKTVNLKFANQIVCEKAGQPVTK